MIFLNITHLNDFWKSYLIGNANRINDNYMLVNGNEYLYKYKSLKRLDLDTNFPNVLNRFIESVKNNECKICYDNDNHRQYDYCEICQITVCLSCSLKIFLTDPMNFKCSFCNMKRDGTQTFRLAKKLNIDRYNKLKEKIFYEHHVIIDDECLGI